MSAAGMSWRAEGASRAVAQTENEPRTHSCTHPMPVSHLQWLSVAHAVGVARTVGGTRTVLLVVLASRAVRCSHRRRSSFRPLLLPAALLVLCWLLAPCPVSAPTGFRATSLARAVSTHAPRLFSVHLPLAPLQLASSRSLIRPWLHQPGPTVFARSRPTCALVHGRHSTSTPSVRPIPSRSGVRSACCWCCTHSSGSAPSRSRGRWWSPCGVTIATPSSRPPLLHSCRPPPIRLASPWTFVRGVEFITSPHPSLEGRGTRRIKGGGEDVLAYSSVW